MVRGECPAPQPDCDYYPDCYSDSDHPYGHGETPVEKDFAESELGHRQLSRREHELINACYVHFAMGDTDFIIAELHRIGYTPKRKQTKKLLADYERGLNGQSDMDRRQAVVSVELTDIGASDNVSTVYEGNNQGQESILE